MFSHPAERDKGSHRQLRALARSSPVCLPRHAVPTAREQFVLSPRLVRPAFQRSPGLRLASSQWVQPFKGNGGGCGQVKVEDSSPPLSVLRGTPQSCRQPPSAILSAGARAFLKFDLAEAERVVCFEGGGMESPEAMTLEALLEQRFAPFCCVSK